MRNRFLEKDYINFTVDEILKIRDSGKPSMKEKKQTYTMHKLTMEDISDISTFVVLNLEESLTSYILETAWFARDDLRKEILFTIDKDSPDAEEFEKWVNAMYGQFICIWGTEKKLEKILSMFGLPVEIAYIDVKKEGDKEDITIKELGEKFYLEWVSQRRKQKQDEEKLKTILNV